MANKAVVENFIKSDISCLVNQFLEGENFSLNLSEYVFRNMSRLSEKSYMDNIKDIKNILNSSKIEFFQHLVIIKSPRALTEEQKMTLVRYINLCHRDKLLIILYNNEVIYIPLNLLINHGKESILAYINSVYRSFINNRLINILKHRFRIKYLFSLFY